MGLFLISSASATGPVLTGPLLAPSCTICIRVSYSTGQLFPVGQVQPDHSKSGGAATDKDVFLLTELTVLYSFNYDKVRRHPGVSLVRLSIYTLTLLHTNLDE